LLLARLGLVSVHHGPPALVLEYEEQ